MAEHREVPGPRHEHDRHESRLDDGSDDEGYETEFKCTCQPDLQGEPRRAEPEAQRMPCHPDKKRPEHGWPFHPVDIESRHEGHQHEGHEVTTRRPHEMAYAAAAAREQRQSGDALEKPDGNRHSGHASAQEPADEVCMVMGTGTMGTSIREDTVISSVVATIASKHLPQVGSIRGVARVACALMGILDLSFSI